MTYKNALLTLKNKPESQRMLLGVAWTKERHPAADAFTPDCGCALAELVPNIINEVKRRSHYPLSNKHFRAYFPGNSKPIDLNGMTHPEANNLERYNDECLGHYSNTNKQCMERYCLVEKWLEEKVLLETTQTDLLALEASKELTKEITTP